MNVSIKLLSENFTKIENFDKQSTKNMICKKMGKCFEFSKNGIYVEKPCQVYMCTPFQVDIVKNDRVLVF